MAGTPTSNRRAFLKSGALIAAPLAAVAAPGVAFAADGSAAKLARIEDERAIEALHRAFLKDARGAKLRGLAGKHEMLRSLAADTEAEPATISFAADGRSAHASHRCSAQIATEFKGSTTIEQMARLQGNAEMLRSKRCTILADYRKAGGEWTLVSARVA